MSNRAIFAPRAPVAGEIVLDVTTTAQVIKVPDNWKGKTIEITPHGASVALRFGATVADCTVTYAAAASVDAGTKVITAHAESGRRCVDGYPRLMRVADSGDEYLGIDASGTGVLSIAPVS